MNDRPLLDHEKLDVYRIAIEFLALALRILEGIPVARRELRGQLERAAMSIPLNIAEGTGKPASADRARFYAIARGSSMECSAILDVCGVVRVADSETIERGKILLGRIVSMLSKMCR
jgi:four helix bundle protein